VVTIANSINRDLDRYISSRRNEGTFSRLFSPKKPKAEPKAPVKVVNEPGFWERLFQGKKEPVLEDLSPEERAKLSQMQEEMAMVDEEEHDHPEEAPQLERVKESIFTRFVKKLRGYEHEHKLEQKAQELETYEQSLPNHEQVKRTLKGLHAWLAKLPDDERSAFRRSPDYQQYKELLEAYGLAKKPVPVTPLQQELKRQEAKPEPKPILRSESKPKIETKSGNAGTGAASAAFAQFAQSAQSNAHKYDPEKDHEYKDIRDLKK